MSLQIDFGIAIQQLRKQRGLSQERLALEADIDRRYMSDVENGKRNISLDIMERIASCLGIQVSELIRKAENINNAPLTIDALKEWLCAGIKDWKHKSHLPEVNGVPYHLRQMLMRLSTIGMLLKQKNLPLLIPALGAFAVLVELYAT